MKKSVHISVQKSIPRRTLIKQAGIALGLPFLDAMCPAFAASTSSAQPAKRFVGISLTLGLHAPYFIPKDSGKNYTPSPYLKSLQDIRNDFTVISGTSHPGVIGGHSAESSIFTACPNTHNGIINNTISIDQLMAKHLGQETRFPSLVLNNSRTSSPSYTENGAMIPAINSPQKLFATLFTDDTPEARQRQNEIAQNGKSILDVVRAESKSLERTLGPSDLRKLDEWYSSIRDLEKRLQINEKWINQPKPKIGKKEQPINAHHSNSADMTLALMDNIFLALRSDSTRFATLHLSNNGVSSFGLSTQNYHTLSHHGKSPKVIKELAIVEQVHVDHFGNFLRKLKSANLLDETMVILTSNLGNASAHKNTNMPVLFAGGGYQHGQHLAFDRTNNYPLPNLYLSMLQNTGLEVDKFATSTSTMTGIEKRA